MATILEALKTAFTGLKTEIGKTDQNVEALQNIQTELTQYSETYAQQVNEVLKFANEACTMKAFIQQQQTELENQVRTLTEELQNFELMKKEYVELKQEVQNLRSALQECNERGTINEGIAQSFNELIPEVEEMKSKLEKQASTTDALQKAYAVSLKRLRDNEVEQNEKVKRFKQEYENLGNPPVPILQKADDYLKRENEPQQQEQYQQQEYQPQEQIQEPVKSKRAAKRNYKAPDARGNKDYVNAQKPY